MLRVKIENDGNTSHKFRLTLSQSGLSGYTCMARLGTLYNADGSFRGTISSADAGLAGVLPAGFDGFIFLPFAEARGQHTCIQNAYDNYSTAPQHMVDLSENYRMTFIMLENNWAGCDVYIDDISYYSGTEQTEHLDLLKAKGYNITAVIQPEKYTLPLSFEDLYNPFVSVDNVYDSADHWVNSGVGLINNDSVLNGEYSLKIDAIRNGNSRTEVTWAKMKGNPDFSKTDFSKVSGIMLRLKITGSKSTAALPFAIRLRQGSLQATCLGRAAKLYDLDGNVVAHSNRALLVNLPADFDGYVFFPFSEAQSMNVTVQGYYDKYETYPQSMVDLSQDFQMYFYMETNSWSGCEVYIDDMDYYSGNTHIDHINKLLELGYAPTAVPQPEKYTLPLTFEEKYNPFVQVDNVYDNSDHWVNEGVGLISDDNVLNGNYSLKIDAIRDGNSRTEVSWAKMKGNPDFSKSDFSKVSGIMLRLKVTGSSSNDALPFAIRIYQSGLNHTCLGNNAMLYDLEGNVIAHNNRTLAVNLPADFDGYVFLPFKTAQSLTVTVAGFYDSYQTYPDNLADLSKDFQMFLYMNGEKWSGCEVYIDDISYYSGNNHADHLSHIKGLGYSGITAVAQPERYSFPLNFDDLFMPFTGVNNIYDATEHQSDSGIKLTGKSEALNGTESVKFEAIKKGNSRTETNWVKMSGINGFSADGFGGMTGIMMRVKIKGDTGNDSHPFALRFKQSGVKEATTLGRGAALYDLKGNKIAVTTTTLKIDLPAGFDGFVFMPFSEAQSLSVTVPGSYDKYETYPENMVDLSKDYTMIVYLGNSSWNGLEVYIDDMTIYTGNEHSDHIELIKSLGYKGITAVPQPSRYSFPFTFDDGIMPFTGVNNIYDAAEHQSSTGIVLTDKSEALIGTASAKFEAIKAENSRTESNRVKMAAVKGFSTKDFSKITGVMMRVKIANDTSEKSHPFALRMWQSGVANPTSLGRGAKLYDLEGYGISAKTNNLNINLPAGFDGYVFMSFEQAQSLTVTVPGSYDKYATYPESLVDLSKEFTMAVYLGDSSWNGTTVYIDDVQFYSGDEHINILKEKYDGIKAVQQPQCYELPLTFDTGMRPWLPAVDDGLRAWKENIYGTAASLTYGKTTISDRDGMVIQFNKDITDSNYYTSGAEVKVADGSKGIMLRLKTNAGEGATIGLRTDYGESGVDSVLFGKPGFLYDLNGNSVDLAMGGYHWRGIYLPENFDGFVFVPFSGGFVEAKNKYTKDIDGWKFENVIRTLQLIFFGDVWAGAKVEIDYIGVYKDTQYLQYIANCGYELDYDTGIIPYAILGEGKDLFYFTTILSENFDQKSLEKLKEWTIVDSKSEASLSGHYKNNVSLENGSLRLQYKKESVGGQSYTAGAILSKTPYGYGYYEASIKLPKIAGTNSSFAIVTENDFRQGGTTFSIDIAYLNKQYELMNGYRYMKDGKSLARGGEIVDGGVHPEKASSSYGGNFHTYGLMYTYSYLRFYVDGVLVREIANDFARGNVYISISGDVTDELSEPLSSDNDSIYVDYIRYWEVDTDEMGLYDTAVLNTSASDNTKTDVEISKENTTSVALIILVSALGAVTITGYVLIAILFGKGKVGK